LTHKGAGTVQDQQNPLRPLTMGLLRKKLSSWLVVMECWK